MERKSRLGPPPVSRDILFWRHVERRHGRCWGWRGSTTKFGYGQIKSYQKKLGAHSVSWEIHYGPIPLGLSVCHRCDNPACCNPEHLFLGTHSENMADATSKGRMRNGDTRGVNNGRAKLTPSDIAVIRSDPRSLTKIASDHSVSHVLIGKIKRREIWKHLP